MAWTRNPAETDPLLLQSSRGDFPHDLERAVVDGGVKEGRPESPDAPGLVSLAVILMILVAVLALVFKWIVYGFP